MAGQSAGTRPLALITGGWKRIGGAIARKLGAEGWDLALHAHRAATFDAEFKAQLEWLGAAVYPVAGDLDDPAFAPICSSIPRRCFTMIAPIRLPARNWASTSGSTCLPRCC